MLAQKQVSEMKLNNIKIKNAQPKDKMYRLCDDDNLTLDVYINYRNLAGGDK